MGNIGDTITTTAPAVGTAGPEYATKVNDLLTEFRTRLSAQVPLSSILTNSDLDLNGQALLDSKYVTLVPESTTPGASPVNRVTAYNGNVWWVGPSGAVQITDGPSLNAAGLGGITGDYVGIGPMQFRYDLANTRYDAFANQSTNTWAYLRTRGLDIAGGATSTVRLRQSYTGTVSQEVKWDDASLAGGVMQIVNSGGKLVTSGTIDADKLVHFEERARTISAFELFKCGYFSGAGTGAIAVDSGGLPKYRLSNTGGFVTMPLIGFHTEGSTLPTVPIKVIGVTWYGLINGGTYPTIEILKLLHDGVAEDTGAMEVGSVGNLTTASSSSGTIQKRILTASDPITIQGDEYLCLLIGALSPNCDTHHVTIHYAKST